MTGPPHQRLSFDTIEVSSIGLLSQDLKPHVLWLTRIPHGDRDGSGDRAYAAVPKSHIRASGGKALLVPLRRSGVTRRVEPITARVVDIGPGAAMCYEPSRAQGQPPSSRHASPKPPPDPSSRSLSGRSLGIVSESRPAEATPIMADLNVGAGRL